jgi:D-alanyl-D-alanine carboxypeptidase
MFEYRRLAKKDEAYGRSLPVVNGVKQEVKLVCAADIAVLLKSNEANKVKVQEQFSMQQLKAPVKAGTSVGKVTFKLNDKELGSTELFTAESIEAKGLLKRLGNKLGL